MRLILINDNKQKGADNMIYKNKYFNILLISLIISIIAGGSYLLYPRDNSNNPKEIAKRIKATDKGPKDKKNKDKDQTLGKKYYVQANRQYKTASKKNKNKLYNAINKKEKVNIDKYFTSFCNEDELLVKLKSNIDKKVIADKYHGTISNSLDNYDYIVLKFSAGINKETVKEEMQKDKDIVLVKDCIHYRVQSIPNDTYYNQQWGLQRIQGELSHDVESYSKVKVAVVDTGVDLTHLDLKGKLIPGYDVVKKTSKVTDNDGHGTHVAGIIGAVTNNSIGISGLTTKIKIMPVGIFHYEGSAGAYMASEDHIAEGIDWARSHGANIINLSLGGGENSPLVAAAVKRAVAAGVTVIAAAGNDGYRNINYPAALPEVIAVGAINQSNGLAEFSNYGPQIDLVAPGVEIRSTFPMKTGMYLTSSGTSMSAPFVSGLAAMIKAKYPRLTPQKIKWKIQSTCTDLGKPGWDEEYGAGLINANEALGGTLVKHPVPAKGDKMEPNNTPSTATVIKYPVSITRNNFAPTSDVDWFKISGVRGKNVLIRLRTNLNDTHGANGVLELYGDRKFAVPIKASNNSEDGTEIINFTFPDDGTYYLKVFDFNDHINNTDYALDITTIPTISSNTHIVNKLADSNDIHWYRIYIPKLNYLNIILNCGKKLDALITLLDKNNLPVKQWDNAPTGKEEVVSYKVKSGSTYYIGVQQVESDSTDLNYNLAVSLGPETSTYSLLNMKVMDSFIKPYEIKYYKLFVDKLGKFQAVVKPSTGHDLVLQLYNSSDMSRELINSSDSGKLGKPDLLKFNFRNKGIYYLGVYDRNGAVTSSYNLVTTYNPSPVINSFRVSSVFGGTAKRNHKITVGVNENSDIDLGVYRDNKLIKKIYKGTIAKSKNFYWDGTNSAGKKVSNGKYNYRLFLKDKVTYLPGDVRTFYFTKKTY